MKFTEKEEDYIENKILQKHTLKYSISVLNKIAQISQRKYI